MEQDNRGSNGRFQKGYKHPPRQRNEDGKFLPIVREAPTTNKPRTPWELLKKLHSGQLNIKTKFGKGVNSRKMILQADPLEYAKTILEGDIALLSAICDDLIQNSFTDGGGAIDDRGRIKLAIGDRGYILFQNSLRQNIQALLKINLQIDARNKQTEQPRDDITILLSSN